MVPATPPGVDDQAVGLSRKEEIRLFDVPARRNAICSKTVRNACQTLVVLELRRCHISSCDFVLECPNLRYCCLAENNICSLPSLSDLECLQFLNLEGNAFDNQQQINNLRHCSKSLLYLSFRNNMIATAAHYRIMILKTILKSKCKLLCLDNYIVSDMEWYTITLSTRPKGLKAIELPHPRFYVSPVLLSLNSSLASVKSFSETYRQLNLKEQLLRNTHRSFSPIMHLQMRIKKYLSIKVYFQVAKVIPKLQASFRRRQFMKRMNYELLRILNDFNCVHLAPRSANLCFDDVKRSASLLVLSTFLKKVVMYFKRKTAGARIVNWARRVRAHRRSMMEYFASKNIGGIVFPSRERDRVIECMLKLQSQYRYLERTASPVKAARARFAEEFVAHDLSSLTAIETAIKTALSSLQESAIIPLPFLRLYTCGPPETKKWSTSYVLYNRAFTNRGQGRSQSAEGSSSSFASPIASNSSKNVSQKGPQFNSQKAMSLSYLFKAKVVASRDQRKTPLAKQRSVKMQALSSRIKDLKEQKSTKNLFPGAEKQGADESDGEAFKRSEAAEVATQSDSKAEPESCLSARRLIFRPEGLSHCMQYYASPQERLLLQRKLRNRGCGLFPEEMQLLRLVLNDVYYSLDSEMNRRYLDPNDFQTDHTQSNENSAIRGKVRFHATSEALFYLPLLHPVLLTKLYLLVMNASPILSADTDEFQAFATIQRRNDGRFRGGHGCFGSNGGNNTSDAKENKRMTLRTCRYFDIFLDADVAAYAAATSIQRFVRGAQSRAGKHSKWPALDAYTDAAHSSRQLVRSMLQRRACVAIQRSWRLFNGLRRRFRLLAEINALARTVHEPELYLDLGVFYRLIRTRYLPDIPFSLTLFPEFRGAPAVISLPVRQAHRSQDFPNDSESVIRPKNIRDHNSEIIYRCAFLPIASDLQWSLLDSHSIREDCDSLTAPLAELREHYNSLLQVRYGIPLWAPWRPATHHFSKSCDRKSQREDPLTNLSAACSSHSVENGSFASLSSSTWANAVEARSQTQYCLLELLTKGVDCLVDEVEPFVTVSKDQSLTSDSPPTWRMVKLVFESVAEARTRAALLMLATYDAQTQKSVKLMTREKLLERIHNKVMSFTKLVQTLSTRSKSNIVGTPAAHSYLTQRTGEPRTQTMTPAQPTWANNIFETEILLADTPPTFELHISHNTSVLSDAATLIHVSDLIRLRFLVDYLSCLPLRELRGSILLCDPVTMTSSQVEQAISDRNSPRSYVSPRAGSLIDEDIEDGGSVSINPPSDRAESTDKNADVDDSDCDSDANPDSLPSDKFEADQAGGAANISSYCGASDNSSIRKSQDGSSLLSSHEMRVRSVDILAVAASLDAQMVQKTDTVVGTNPTAQLSPEWTTEETMFKTLVRKYVADIRLQTSRIPILGPKYRTRMQGKGYSNEGATEAEVKVEVDVEGDEAEVKEEYPSNIWTVTRLLCWCATNDDIFEPEHVDSRSNGLQDQHSKSRHANLQQILGSSHGIRSGNKTSVLNQGKPHNWQGREHDYYTLSTRDRRVLNFRRYNPILLANKGYRVLRECIVVPSLPTEQQLEPTINNGNAVSDKRRTVGTTGTETAVVAVEQSPRKTRPHTAQPVTSIHAMIPSAQSTSASVMNATPTKTGIQVDNELDDRRQGDASDAYHDHRTYMSVRAQTAHSRAIREKLLNTQLLLEQEQIEQAQLNAKRAEIINSKQVRAEQRQQHDEVLKHTGLLSGMIRRMEHVGYAQLKANRMQYLLQRVKSCKQKREQEHEEKQAIHAASGGLCFHGQPRASAELFPDMTDSLHDSTMEETLRQGIGSPQPASYTIAKAPLGSDLLCVTPLSSRRKHLRPRSASSVLRQPLSLQAPPPTPPNPNRDASIDTHLDGGALYPTVDDQHVSDAVPLLAPSSRRESFRRRSVLTVGTTASKTPTIEIPAPSIEPPSHAQLEDKTDKQSNCRGTTEGRSRPRPQSAASHRHTTTTNRKTQTTNPTYVSKTPARSEAVPIVLGSMNNSSILSLEQASTASIAVSVNAVLTNLSRLNSAGTAMSKAQTNTKPIASSEAKTGNQGYAFMDPSATSTQNKDKIGKLMRETGNAAYYHQFFSGGSEGR